MDNKEELDRGTEIPRPEQSCGFYQWYAPRQQVPAVKPKKRGCLIFLAVFMTVCFAVLFWSAYGFSKLFVSEKTEFTKEDISTLEERLCIDIPEDGTLKKSEISSGPGDAPSGRYHLDFEGISDPEKFMENAFANGNFHIVDKTDENYGFAVEQINAEHGLWKDRSFKEPDVIYEIVVPDDGKRKRHDYYAAFADGRDGSKCRITVIMIEF
ncbi:hypothetical protein [Ruminococcus sp.]|uniref:hypothetical protein n=1 Tax=Ruminococcus sp. TaxID=41978 RepID=UPI0025EE4923|nr:hypothetical protein [Ruminococcus sp.]MBQ8965954.1 hypothetical protein [Ruminococcus sp.]